MYCMYCGYKNDDDAKFCQKCGREMIYMNRPRMDTIIDEPVKTRSKAMLITVLIILFVSLAGMIGSFIYVLNKNENKINLYYRGEETCSIGNSVIQE